MPMRYMTLFCRATFSALIFAGLAEAAVEEARPRFNRYLPENTYFAAFAQDVAATCAAFQKTGIGAVMCGAELHPCEPSSRRENRPRPCA